MTDGSNLEQDLSPLALLDEPVRDALYVYVVSKGRPVGRDEAARKVGVSRALAAFHLDRLAEAGLLDTSYARLTGKSGPGAGRPAKVYRRSAREFHVSVPPRDYFLMARLLAEALAGRADPRRALTAAARGTGMEIGREVRRRAGRRAGRARLLRALTQVLEEHGFEPRGDGSGTVVLANCPFDVLSREYTALVCGTNRSLFQGLVEGLGSVGKVSPVTPKNGGCCVRIAL
jgi:predicted ArsR family transcriptional regulator